MKRILIILGCLIQTSLCLAQPDSLWSQAYGIRGNQNCKAAIQSINGSYVIAGRSLNLEYEERVFDFYVVKASADGEEMWSRHVGGENREFCFSIVEAPDSGYVLSGLWDTGGTNLGLLTKLSEEGDSLWSRFIGGQGVDEFFCSIGTSDDALMFAGNTSSFGAGSFDGWLVKTDLNGEVLWQRAYGGRGSDAFRAVIQTFDGGYALAGKTSSYGGGRYDFFLVRVDSSGDELWRNHYGTESMDVCYDAIQTSDGGFILGGFSYFHDQSGDFYVVKTDDEGEMLWERFYSTDGGFNDILHSLIQTEDGGYVFAGGSGGYRHLSSDDYYIIRTDSIGEVLWEIGYGGRNNDVCKEVFATPDGGYAFAGTSRSFGQQDDFWLVKTGPDPLIVPRLLDPNYPSDFMVEAPFPNPFNSVTSLTFKIPTPDHVKLSVFDSKGREVANLLDTRREAGYHTVNWNADEFSSGVYFYRIQAGEFTGVKKMTLIR